MSLHGRGFFLLVRLNSCLHIYKMFIIRHQQGAPSAFVLISEENAFSGLYRTILRTITDVMWPDRTRKRYAIERLLT